MLNFLNRIQNWIQSIAWSTVIITALIAGFFTLISSDLAAAIYTDRAARRDFPATVEAVRTQTVADMQSSMNETAQLPVSLLSISYLFADFDPHLVDLRTADTLGIGVVANSSLQFQDVWLNSPDALEAGYEVQLKVYDNPELSGGAIGETEIFPLTGSKIGPEAITVMRYDHGDVENSWNVQEGWLDDFLYLALETTYQGEITNVTTTPILLKENGAAWLMDTPMGNVASIVYSVNDGPELILDIPRAMQSGLNVGENDMLTLHTVWYHVRDAATHNEDTDGHMAAYVTANGYNPDTVCTSEFMNFEEGISQFKLESAFCPHPESNGLFRWQIPEDNQLLIITLSRRDRTILDRLEIPLRNEGSEGLVQFRQPQSIVRLNYQTDDMDTHAIDLRESEKVGIPEAHQIIKLVDVWAYSSEINPDQCIYIEVHANPEGLDPIGTSRCEKLTDNMVFLGDVGVNKFEASSDKSDFWLVSLDWSNLFVVLVTQQGNLVIHKEVTRIPVNQ